MNSGLHSPAPPTVVVRRAGAGDWPAVAALLHEYAAWMHQHAGFDPYAVQPAFAVELRDLAGHYADPDKTLLVAAEHGRLAGCIAVICHPDGGAELKRMYVTPAARGQGLADALVAAAVKHATGRRCEYVWLESVQGPMDAAIAVYARNGFVPVDGAPTIDVDGTVVMRRALLLSNP